MRANAAGVSLRDGLRARVSVERAERGGDDAVERSERAQLLDLVERDEPARDTELVLQGDARFERGDVLGSVEQEQVADLVEIDLGPGRSAKRSNASMLRRPIAMLSGSENCARTPPAARLVEPPASWSRSTRQTSTPASARWNAMLVPMTPPPTTTTSADGGSELIGARGSSGRTRDSPDARRVVA